MKTLKKYSFLIFAAALSIGSCDKMLDVKPRQSIPSTEAFTSPEGFYSATIGVYDAYQGTSYYGRDMLAMPEVLADNAETTGKSGRLVAQYQNQPYAHLGIFYDAYAAINKANLIIDNADIVPKLEDSDKHYGLAQVHFLRALAYFDLARVYAYEPGVIIDEVNKGGVPLILKGVDDLSKITYPKRASIPEVYAQIYKDLDASVAYFEKVSSNESPQFASKEAALALYSRVALYNKDWDNCIKNATESLNATSAALSTTKNYVSDWREKVHPESIFELNYVTIENLGVNEALQTTYTTLAEVGDKVTTQGFGDVVPTRQFLALHKGEDVRLELYELGTAGRGPARIECTKFMGKNGQPNLDNIPVIRIAELYLNRAEAYAKKGNASAALADLNEILTNRGLSASTTTDAGKLLTEIYLQKRLEYAFEGHRFFDLKRNGFDIVKLPNTIEYGDFRILAPFPNGELFVNPNLVQNQGY